LKAGAKNDPFTISRLNHFVWVLEFDPVIAAACADVVRSGRIGHFIFSQHRAGFLPCLKLINGFELALSLALDVKHDPFAVLNRSDRPDAIHHAAWRRSQA
jgi:hypothetical protein